MNNTTSGENDGDPTFRRTRSARRTNAWRKKRSGSGVSAKTRSCFYTDVIPDSAETAAATPCSVVIKTMVSNGDFETDSESWSHSGSDSGNRSRPESETMPLSSEEDDDEDSDDDSLSRKSSTESMKRKKAYNVAREIMTSEKVFVDVLKLLNEDFQKFVKNESKRETGSIPDDVFAQILDCLPNLQALNEDLLKCMVERIKKWNEIGQISDVIMKHGPFLKLYTTYIQKFPTLTNSLEEACKKYTRFAEAVKKFELSERCQRLTVKHYMLKPVQRIPQYKLLLQEYQKYIDETSVEYENTRIALDVVSEVAEHANRAIKEAEKFEKLLEIQNRIYGGYEVVKPGRKLLKEGELNKLCRKGMATRTFLMFNDSLLHCSMSQGFLRVHHELPLSTVKIEVPCQEAYQNEFSIISVTRSFTLSACSPEEKQEWLKALQDAIDNETRRRKTFLQVKLNMQQAAISGGGCDDSLGKKAPVWIPDSRVTMCQLCAREFTFAFRRHHCRACGKVVCSVCSSKRAPLRYLKYRAMRVCDKCFDTLQKEVEEGKIELDESAEPTISGQACFSPSIGELKAQFQKFSGDESTKYLKAKPNVRQVLKEVGANDTESSAKGYLYFKTKKIWKKQWFVIKDKVLYCYKASEDVVALSSTPLLGFDMVVFDKPKGGIHQKLYFELRHLGHPNMEFYAESIESATRWQLAMKEATILE